MKRLLTIAIIIGLMSCGTYEDESNHYLSASANMLMLKQKVKKDKRVVPVQIGELLKKVEVSVSNNETDLFKDNSANEFLINSVIDIHIGAKFSYFTGTHKLGISVYLPDGSLYRKSEAEVDFGVQGVYSINGIIIEGTDAILIAKYIIPVAGTELSIFNLTGLYNAEFSLDNSVVAKLNFVLK